jgi:excinuclease ABC subunit A
VLHKLRDDGNTIVVIEHNLDVIKTADWVIDLGPEGGHRGGTILATGTPEDIAGIQHSHTGRFLAKVLGTEAKPTKPAPAPRPEAPRPPTKAEKVAAKKAAKKAAKTAGKRKSAA